MLVGYGGWQAEIFKQCDLLCWKIMMAKQTGWLCWLAAYVVHAD
jgi:hypothetical protein